MVDKIATTPPTHEEVTGICKTILEDVIGQNNGYQHTEAVKWNQKAVETITENLVALNLSCIIMQTGLGAGLNVASTCYWNKATDYSFAYRWESKAVIAIVNVFAIALQ